MQRANKLTTVIDESIQTIPLEDSIESPQLVYLEFEGATTFYVNAELGVVIGNITVESSGFDENDISAIVASLNGMFDDVVFTSEIPSGGAFSTVYVGVTSAFDGYGKFMGLAETIDSGNQIHDDNAFVLLGSSAGTEFVVSVIAHETEHIVHGLEHGGEGLQRFAQDYVVSEGEELEDIEIGDGDTLQVENGGLVTNATVYGGGQMVVCDGGVAGITAEGDAGSVLVFGSLDVNAGGEAQNVTMDGGHMVVGGTVVNTSLCAGSVFVNGTANFMTMQAGFLEVADGGLVSSLLVSSNGMVNVLNGGKVSATTLRGTMTVSSGGFAETVSVYAGGNFIVDGGSAKNVGAYYDNGVMTITNGGRAENIILHSGGTMDISSSGVIYNTMLVGGCSMIVQNGGLASAVSVSGVMAVRGGGVASENTIAYGTMTIFSGGMANVTTMSGGSMDIYSGGKANDTTMSGGVMNIYDGGKVSDTTMSGGNLHIYSSGTHSGTLSIASGAAVFVENGTVIDFTVAAQENKNVPLIDHYDRIEGAGDATYTLTVKSDLESGSYALAGYATDFRSSITVKTDTQQELGSLSVNGILKTDDFTYTLSLADGTLSLGVNLDMEAPVLSSLNASPEGVTNQDVTVTATFTDNVGVASTQYRINSGTWQDYVDGVVMTANGTVEFQATDAVGNVSDIAVYEVTNIDKVAPTITDVSADITAPTTGSVTVTATFADDVALASQEYKIGNGDWTVYTSGAVVTSNATVQFRAVDSAGNVSDIVDYEVTNILEPLELNIAYSTKERTNERITLIVTANRELVKVEYTLTNGREWIEVAKTADGFTFTRDYNGSFNVRGTDAEGNVGIATAAIWNVDRVGPARPTITASTQALTNQNVVLTAAWSTDSVEATREYSFDQKTWTAYTGPVEVEQNCNVYFRSADDLGNIGYDRKYKVTNIDKVAPKAPKATPSTTKSTNQDVTVKSSKTYGVKLLEFSKNGATWSEYTEPIVFSENGSVQFRATDAAGNVSDITTCHVSNIDKVAPDAPVVTASVTTPTIAAVRLTATWAADAYKKQYSINGGSTWKSYKQYVLVKENTLVLFRAIDKAGNVSEIISQDVNNILQKGSGASAIIVSHSASIQDSPNHYQDCQPISSGDDVLPVQPGDNLLCGAAGNDNLFGSDGNDVIVGGAGNDLLRGGGGDDLFAFGGNWGQDIVEQLENGKVTLWFDDGDESKWNPGTLTYTDGDQSVTVSGVNEVTLKFGDDGSERYRNLLASGAFGDSSSCNIFESKGMLA
ncbi:MAG: AIDA repeat-containing protein [Victivallales bacterium]|nr:AIDA repeat-containing protein [Victivallales bacterium]